MNQGDTKSSIASGPALSPFPFRERDYACIHPETYRYFVSPTEVDALWMRLEDAFGPKQINHSFRTQQIDGVRLLLRATLQGNPITVIRKRTCRAEDVQGFHTLVGYHE